MTEDSLAIFAGCLEKQTVPFLSPSLALLSVKFKLSGVPFPANQSSHGVCLDDPPFNYNSFKNANLAIIIMALLSLPDKEGLTAGTRTADGSIPEQSGGVRRFR